jgi:hypothetical protein
MKIPRSLKTQIAVAVGVALAMRVVKKAVQAAAGKAPTPKAPR